jgi:hypothetical protein
VAPGGCIISLGEWLEWIVLVPITPYLTEQDHFDPETRRIMGLAFETALSGLRLLDRSDPFVGLVASKIIALSKGGENNPDHLCEPALQSLGIQQQTSRT